MVKLVQRRTQSGADALLIAPGEAADAAQVSSAWDTAYAGFGLLGPKESSYAANSVLNARRHRSGSNDTSRLVRVEFVRCSTPKASQRIEPVAYRSGVLGAKPRLKVA